MLYSLHQLPDTTVFVISGRESVKAPAMLVAEVVTSLDGIGFTLLRMDATGVLAENLPSPLSAWSFYLLWVRYCGPTITGVPIS